jgi:hypothetical protein
MDTFEEVWERLDPETRAMLKRGSEVDPPVYETEEEMCSASALTILAW